MTRSWSVIYISYHIENLQKSELCCDGETRATRRDLSGFRSGLISVIFEKKNIYILGRDRSEKECVDLFFNRLEDNLFIASEFLLLRIYFNSALSL